MQCHKCKYDQRNGGTQEQRQEHCLTCNFEETASKRLKGRAADGKSRVIELDDSKTFSDFTLLHPIDPNKDNDILADLELEETQVALIMEFVESFAALPIRTRLVCLSLLEQGGANNTKIMQQTGLARPTVIEKRKYLESDPFWSKMLRRAAVYQQQTRKKVVGKRGLKKGAKLKIRKWGSKYRLGPDGGEG